MKKGRRRCKRGRKEVSNVRPLCRDVGRSCRFGGERAAREISAVCAHGLKVVRDVFQTVRTMVDLTGKATSCLTPDLGAAPCSQRYSGERLARTYLFPQAIRSTCANRTACNRLCAPAYDVTLGVLPSASLCSSCVSASARCNLCLAASTRPWSITLRAQT